MKKLIAFVLAAMMCLSIVACGSKQETPASTTTQPAQTQTPSSTTTEPAQPTETKLDFPTHDIKFINPNSAGGGVDVLCRLIANEAQTRKMFNGQNLVVECMPGGGSALGQAYVAKQADPDGYTLLAITASIVNNPILNADTVEFKTEDFKWISIFAEVPSIVIVPKDSPANDWNSLDALAKSEGLIWSTSGNGNATHTNPLLWAQDRGWQEPQFLHQASAAEQCTQIMGGHADAAVMTIAEGLSAVQSGEAKCLAIFAPAGSTYDVMPDVKTAADQGFDWSIVNIRGIAVRADVPEDRYNYLVNEFNTLFTDADFQAAVNETGNFACARTPAEVQKWAEETAATTLRVQELLAAG